MPRYAFGPFTLDSERRMLAENGNPIPISGKAFDVLLLLLDNRGRPVDKDELMSRVWPGIVVEESNLAQSIHALRRALRERPREPIYIATIAGRGYQFVAPVISNQQSKPPVPEDSKTAENQPARQSRTRRWLVLASLVTLIPLALAYIALRGRVRDVGHSKINSLAVLPLKNLSGDPAQEYLADGMTEELIGRLTGIHDLRVVSRTSVMRFKDAQPSVPEIARTLNVDAVVEGSVIREGTRIRVHAQLIRGATDDHFWSETYDRELRDVLGLQSEVAESIALKVKATITGGERSRLTKARAVSPEVYESYLKGLYVLRKEPSTKGALSRVFGISKMRSPRTRLMRQLMSASLRRTFFSLPSPSGVLQRSA